MFDMLWSAVQEHATTNRVKCVLGLPPLSRRRYLAHKLRAGRGGTHLQESLERTTWRARAGSLRHTEHNERESDPEGHCPHWCTVVLQERRRAWVMGAP